MEPLRINPCLFPTPQTDYDGDGRKRSMHERFVQQARTSEPEVLFIGDSIIEQLQFSSLWTDKISSLHCVNFGIGGDRVENVLWRMQNGELDFNVRLKAVVLFAGTNNTADCDPQEILDGIVEIIAQIKQKLGNDVVVIVPTLLPRGQHPNPYREKNRRVNELLIDKLGRDANGVHLVRIHEGIVQNDGSISHHVLHDYLHLTNAAYAKIFGPVYDKLCELLHK